MTEFDSRPKGLPAVDSAETVPAHNDAASSFTAGTPITVEAIIDGRLRGPQIVELLRDQKLTPWQIGVAIAMNAVDRSDFEHMNVVNPDELLKNSPKTPLLGIRLPRDQKPISPPIPNALQIEDIIKLGRQ